MTSKQINQLLSSALKKIQASESLATLEELKTTYLGRHSELAKFLRTLKDLEEKERKTLGTAANKARKEIEDAIKEVKKTVSHTKKKIIDITAPGKRITRGHLHPITSLIREIESIFKSMGFAVIEGPEVETEWYNFDALNMPGDHPARGMQDTFWVKQSASATKDPKKHAVLRTHTTPVDVRFLEKHQPPFRILIPGRVFRNEATDMTHEMQFYQFDSLMVDRNISIAHLKGVVTHFFKRFFRDDVEVRFVSSFFPFTEPSVEIFVKGTKGVLKNKWIEVAGAGMLHQNVFKAAGLPPREWQGFAFGMTIDRLILLRHKVEDIRLLYGGDLRFLKQF